MGQTLSCDCCTNQEYQSTQGEQNPTPRKERKQKNPVFQLEQDKGVTTPQTGRESNQNTRTSTNGNNTKDSQYLGFVFNNKKKNLNDVVNKWKIRDDDDTISDVSNSQDEVTKEQILIHESQSTKSVPEKNLSSMTSEEQNTVENPQEKTLNEINNLNSEQRAKEENQKVKKVERQRLIEVLKMLLEQQNDDALESDYYEDEESKEQKQRTKYANLSKKRVNDQLKNKKGQQAHWKFVNHINFNKEVPTPEQNILGPLRDELQDNPSFNGESIIQSLSAGISPFKRVSRERSNTQFESSEIEWSQSNAEDVGEKWKIIKMKRINMYTTDENNDVSIKRDSQTEDDSDFKSIMRGFGGTSQINTQIDQSNQSQAPVDPQAENKELSLVSERDEEKFHSKSKSNGSLSDPEIDQINQNLDILNEENDEKAFVIGSIGAHINKMKIQKSGPLRDFKNLQTVKSDINFLDFGMAKELSLSPSPLLPKNNRSLTIKRTQIPENFNEQIQPALNPEFQALPVLMKKDSPIDKKKKPKDVPICNRHETLKGLLKNFKPKARVIKQEHDEFSVQDKNVDCTWQRTYNFKRKSETYKKQKSQFKNANRSLADIDLNQMQTQQKSPQNNQGLRVPKSSSYEQLIETPVQEIVRQNSATQLSSVTEADIPNVPVIQNDEYL